MKFCKQCRICQHEGFQFLFSLGNQFVSDFVTDKDLLSGHQVPIEIVRCPRCGLVQQQYTAPQDFLYTRHYWYRSGVTDTMRSALRDITRTLEELPNFLKPGDIVLDIGSNDGTLLRSYTKPDLIRVGVEPAQNLAEEGAKGVDVFINDFWSESGYANRVVGYLTADTTHSISDYEKAYKAYKAKVITAVGMFYDLEDPNRFIKDVAYALAPDGIFVAQLMCLANTMSAMDVGNFAHEHLEFYSLQSLDYLFGAHGLEIFDLELNGVNGESYRLYVKHKGVDLPKINPGFDWLGMARRREARFNDLTLYYEFFDELEANKAKVVSYLQEQHDNGKCIWVYGASTKGNVILQYLGLDHMLISGAADRSPEKWGRYTVGTHIPIFSEEKGRAEADIFLVLPYAFLPEFLERESEWRSRGGKFVVPLPLFQVY